MSLELLHRPMSSRTPWTPFPIQPRLERRHLFTWLSNVDEVSEFSVGTHRSKHLITALRCSRCNPACYEPSSSRSQFQRHFWFYTASPRDFTGPARCRSRSFKRARHKRYDHRFKTQNLPRSGKRPRGSSYRPRYSCYFLVSV
jgi:hypothetical protein